MNTEQTNSQEKKRLIEPMHLIIVLALTGILVAIAYPSIMKAHEVKNRNKCIESQSKIDGAKQQWALKNNIRDVTAKPTVEELIEGGYLHETPKCPSGGSYYIGAINEDPTCSLGKKEPFLHEFAICETQEEIERFRSMQRQ